MTEENQTPKLTQETLFDKLVSLYENIWDLEQDCKDLISQAKEEDEIEDITLINQIAKAKAYSKIGSLQEKAKKQLDKIEELGF
jgi:predicted RecB family endonuclease